MSSLVSTDTSPLMLVDHKDIRIYQGNPAFHPDPLCLEILSIRLTFFTDATHADCSSLEGKRVISNVFDILDIAVLVGSSDAFVLQEIHGAIFLSTVYERDATGTFKPGSYIIVPQEDGALATRKLVMRFETTEEERRLKKKAKDEGPRGFKMRLVHRDKGCVVCHAEGKVSIYQYRDDSQFYHGSHIFPFAMQSMWTGRGYQGLIADPYTEMCAENATRNNRDPLRINSLENGLLLCLFHHKAYETYRFSIHPTTHKIVVFHPVVACLQDLEVTSPWKDPNPKYPSPHNDLLEAHFQTSIFASLSAATEPLDDDSDNEDDHDEDEDEDD